MPPKLNQDIYGGDPTGTAEGIASRILGNPDPTLDIHGERDERAVSEGNHGTQGGGRSGQSEPANSDDNAMPSKDGGTGS